MEVYLSVGIFLVGIIVVGHYFEDRFRIERPHLWRRYIRGPSSLLAIGYAIYLYLKNQPNDAFFVGGIGLFVFAQLIYDELKDDSH